MALKVVGLLCSTPLETLESAATIVVHIMKAILKALANVISRRIAESLTSLSTRGLLRLQTNNKEE